MEPTKKDWKLYRERIGDWEKKYEEFKIERID